jgi:hypothetical protein
VTTAIIHSFIPAGGSGGMGGIDWGLEGTNAETQVRAQFALDVDAQHHDYLPSHVHRLVKLRLPDGLSGQAVTDHLEAEHLDAIEGGHLDDTEALLAKHDPNAQGETL